jgi:hypothetical protein
VKLWNNELIKSFSESFKYKEPQANLNDISNLKTTITGPLSKLFPLMLKQNFYEVYDTSSLVQYVESMKDNMILPYKMNMFHYYAFYNYQDCVSKAFEC